MKEEHYDLKVQCRRFVRLVASVLEYSTVLTSRKYREYVQYGNLAASASTLPFWHHIGEKDLLGPGPLPCIFRLMARTSRRRTEGASVSSSACHSLMKLKSTLGFQGFPGCTDGRCKIREAFGIHATASLTDLTPNQVTKTYRPELMNILLLDTHF